ncbi:hypothetical protein IQ268_09785 [Oculatella sp. LEGE 06141]|uniref:hypothetical protein n=1 Tax=Oculatella sp. LEGE 06141 TaxID=1828648 RepID=UPI00187EC539|nr:hypothetical protein [Oculatella sp. LEGE 06141]MBE9178849.1 hypothetical protein [Oculatella sp. LEGE 06141]
MGKQTESVMRSNQTYLDHSHLERSYVQSAASTKLSIWPNLKQVWQRLSHWWDGNNEPEIYEIFCPSGVVFWEVNDQFNNERYQFDTEDQVLTWLENRHRQPSRLEGWGNDWTVNG